MIAPGSKNWIVKYYSLVENNNIQLDASEWYPELEQRKSERIIQLAEISGLIYGSPNKLLFSEGLELKITNDERLKLLLFESLIFIYLLHNDGRFSANDFNEKLLNFYSLETSVYDHKWYHFSESKDDHYNLEKLFTNRIKIKSGYTDRNFWFNHLSNGLLFIDLILFHAYCGHQQPTFKERFDPYAEMVLIFIYGSVGLIPDDIKAKVDLRILKNILYSAELESDQRDQIKSTKASDSKYLETQNYLSAHPMLANFCYHLWVFIHHDISTEAFLEFESNFSVAQSLNLDSKTAYEIYWDCKKSLDEHTPENVNKVSETESKVLYDHLSEKYTKILGRNKDKFIQELRESKELTALVKKSMTQELTPKEKEAVKNQFYDLMKTVPSIGLFLVPGGSLLLPLILKIVPSLLPSAFKENEVEDKKD